MATVLMIEFYATIIFKTVGRDYSMLCPCISFLMLQYIFNLERKILRGSREKEQYERKTALSHERRCPG